jgi:UPF0042 nucleotide-binding protein
MIMKIVIVTGMSGAGKRTALKVLEDAGYYCVDNLPVELVLKFVELAMASSRQVNIAIGVDVRVGDTFSDLTKVLERMQHRKYEYEVLFLDADDEVLVKRYKETRRNHPLAGDHRVIEGIQKEREELAFIKDKADYIIDTSTLLTRDLKQELEKIFVDDENFKNLMVTILSFGFKYGIPADADLVFDVRFLPNPYYNEKLRPLTGNDKPIQDFVMGCPQAVEFMDKLEDMINFLIPNYILEGKNSLVIAVGCTGGKHRSVTLANELYRRLSNKDYGVRIEHRDIMLDSLRKK